jgi:hypothetical protein
MLLLIWFGAQGLAVIFSHHQVCVKRRREDTFFAAQSESRISAPFFASKTVVFVLPIKLMQISLFFAD